MNRILLALSLMVTGCGGYKSLNYYLPDEIEGPYFERGDTSLQPLTDRMDDKCMQYRHFDTCIFQKNPVAQEETAVGIDQLEDNRRFGVKIRNLATNGFLENSKLQVLTLNTPRFTLQQLNLFKMPFTVMRSYAEQLSAYYWADRIFTYLEPRLGNRIPPVVLKIYADDTFTGYLSSKDSIHLEKSLNKVPAAFSADIITHLVGEAMADKLSGKKLFAGDRSVQHKFCELNPHGCCATQIGCSQALAHAFGDYLVGMMNPMKPRVGEAAAANPAGQIMCGIPRDLATLSAQTQLQVFSACSAGSAGGKVSLMGAWYASLWWKVRAQAEAARAGQGFEVDQLFFDHAKTWTGTTTFAEAKVAAINLSKSFKGGKFTAAFETVFTAIAQ